MSKAPTLTSNRECTPLTNCSASQYVIVPPTPTSNRRCANCSACGTGFFQAHACSALRDTICSPVSNCSSRCEFDSNATVCKRRGTTTPCSAYTSAATCPSDRCRFMSNSTVKCQPLPPSSDNQEPIPVGTVNCERLTYAYCSGTCTWDFDAALCRVKTCSDYMLQSDCTAAGCTFETSLGYCRGANEVVPCERYFSQALCNSVSSRCTFNALTSTCHANDSNPACELFTRFGASQCPSSYCDYDATAPLCKAKGSLTPCSLYTSSSSCSIAGTEYQGAAATATTDSVCRRATVCSAQEFEQLPLLPSRDRLCVALVDCAADQYQTRAPTATSQRQCANLTRCQAGSQFELVPPTATTNRICNSVSTCSFLNGGTGNDTFVWRAATPTSDTVCASVRQCNTTEQYTRVAPTPTSNRGEGGMALQSNSREEAAHFVFFLTFL